MIALEEEMKMPFIRGEGPVGIILCPSRELATQTYDNVVTWCSALAKEGKYPQLNTVLCIGGISMNDQSHALGKGLHIVVATPGRLIDMLEKKRFTFNNCKYLCMDEADRMIDLGFEDDVRNIMSFFKVRISSILSYSSSKIDLSFTAPKTNVTVFSYHAQEDPRFRPRVFDKACSRQCRTRRCSKSRRASSRRVCQARSENGVSFRMSAENSSSGYHIQRKQKRGRW